VDWFSDATCFATFVPYRLDTRRITLTAAFAKAASLSHRFSMHASARHTLLSIVIDGCVTR
jgi:hypothetical protein